MLLDTAAPDDCRELAFVPFLLVRWPRRTSETVLLVLLLAGLVAGCAMRGPDWKSLIGVATYDEAVLQLGPPNSVATLEDGTKVAEWLQSASRVYSTPGVGYGVWGPWGGGWSYGTVNSTPNVFLLLTFGPDQKLASVRHLYK
ncbi:MAG TPA: hypothetical protein PLX89_06870 [Verrucomicrobiota bacterium]|nr:hypothetical protein [Verrucomicrobiota bacterium]